MSAHEDGLREDELQRLADAIYRRGRATGRYLGGPIREAVAQIVADRLAAHPAAPDAPQGEVARRTTCGAGADGECYMAGCVQILDGEPEATGRFCPLPIGNPVLALRESEPVEAEGGGRDE